MSLAGKTLFITGASRGIGLAIALRAARDGANIVIAAKTGKPHPNCLARFTRPPRRLKRPAERPCRLCVIFASRIRCGAPWSRRRAHFGGIDICVNNASAISLPTLATDTKRFDLMHQINARGTSLVTKTCIPHLRRAANPHVLMLSPPLDMSAKWFAGHTAYTMAKFGMSMCVLGMAAELPDEALPSTPFGPGLALPLPRSNMHWQARKV